jgi:hypothetical protein
MRTLRAALGLASLLTLVPSAAQSPQQKIAMLNASQARIAELQREVVKAPDDRATYRNLLMKQMPEQRSPALSDDVVFIDGHNFTEIFDYPKNAQTFLYTRCEPADEQQPERIRCW